MKNIIKDILKLFQYSGFKPSSYKFPRYHFKPNFLSTHSITVNFIKDKSNVLDIGCNSGEFINYLKKKKKCNVLGIDRVKKKNIIVSDLEKSLPNINYKNFDYIIILDVIEHLSSPEFFLNNLKKKIKFNKKVKIIFTTPNIAFFPIRMSLLFGNFNYASKGILDFTHKRLFTFDSFNKLLTDYKFKILERIGVPAPFPLVLGKNFLSLFLIRFNNLLIKFSKKLFSFQMLFVAKL